MVSKEIEVAKLLKTDSDLSLEQIQKFFSKTPASKVKQRPAKGGGQWDYVSGSYVTQVLNSLFAFNWSFEVVTSMTEAVATANTGTVVVQGRLKVKIGDNWITKEQYGRKDVTFRKGTKDALDFGNDLKAAATDAKKKCASELGLFADVYSQEDFFEAQIVVADQTGEDATDKILKAQSTDEIKEIFDGLDAESKQQLAQLATNRKAELDES